ncbi:protein N-terminal asparagine amidohydrolase, partial [Phalaenopsis equestris]|uniref:protein N-terminal asparagine amidohydrolase n=1 Tax=Phalaenopsis equestris TaxID=78828 RepID=UPI0009E4D2D5
MIYVEDLPLTIPETSSKGNEILPFLLEHPMLIAASNRLKETPEKMVSFSEESPPAKYVYVFQREYATVDPSVVEFVGTDEATTCAGLVIRNHKTKMTSIAHMDFVEAVDLGLTQMLSSVVDGDVNATFDVHLIGSFEDMPNELVIGSNESGGRQIIPNRYSVPLCAKIVEALQNRRERFQLQTCCVLSHNTKRDLNGSAVPIISGFVVETSSGSVVPACFDKTSRVPDEIVRRIRVTVSSKDPYWKGRLLETYDTLCDRIVVAPCTWMLDWGDIAFSLQQLSDYEILMSCSTSPAAEAPDFVENERRMWSYLIKYPDWRRTFTGWRPRIFDRNPKGGWSRC